MTGASEFQKLFGDVSLWQLVELGLAVAFALALWRKVRKYILERHDAEQERDKQLAQALDSINKYPQYRAQSLKIQQELRGETIILSALLRRHLSHLSDRIMAPDMETD